MMNLVAVDWGVYRGNIDGLAQNCSIFSGLVMEILQSCTKPSTLYWCLTLGYGTSSASAMELVQSCNKPPIYNAIHDMMTTEYEFDKCQPY